MKDIDFAATGSIVVSGPNFINIGGTLFLRAEDGGSASFAVFVSGTATVAFDPANNRGTVRFTDSGDVVRGATSVAVRTR